MNKTDQGQDTPQAEASEFSWDSLPEVAKERWEEMIAYSSTIENQLAKAKASREQAEIERQSIAKEVLGATKEACQAVIVDAKRTLDKIKSKTEEAEQTQIDAKRQLEEAKTIRAEAETYREAVVARAEQQADEMLERARTAAEAESARLKKQVSFEAHRMLAQAEALRGAAREELEAQRIYAEAAMADVHDALDQLRAQLEVPEPYIGSRSESNENGVNGQGHIWEMANRWGVTAEPAPSEETPQSVESTAGSSQSDATAMPRETTTAEPAPSEETPQSIESTAGPSQSDAPATSNHIGTAEPAASQEALAAAEPENGASPDSKDSEDPQKIRSKDRRIKAA